MAASASRSGRYVKFTLGDAIGEKISDLSNFRAKLLSQGASNQAGKTKVIQEVKARPNPKYTCPKCSHKFD